jgi:hypothetical protein
MYPGWSKVGGCVGLGGWVRHYNMSAREQHVSEETEREREREKIIGGNAYGHVRSNICSSGAVVSHMPMLPSNSDMKSYRSDISRTSEFQFVTGSAEGVSG